MGRTFLFVVVAAVVGVSTASRCGRFPECPDFNATRYLGTWYEQSRSGKNLIFEKNCNCVTANYTIDPTDSSKIVVSNGCTRGSNTTSIALGTATADGPCKLQVKFPPSPFSGPYRVVFTDYDTYTVVASCRWWLHIFNWEMVWILSREPSLPEARMDEIFGRLKDLGFQYDDMYRTPQGADCVGQGYPVPTH